MQHVSADYPVNTAPPGACIYSGMWCCATCCPCCLGKQRGRTRAGVKLWKKDHEAVDNSRSQEELGIKYLDLKQTMKDHAQSYRDHGMELGPWLISGASGGKVRPVAAEKMSR